MENQELVEKRLKKSSSIQLVEKLTKNKFSQSEVVAAVNLLESRGQDVSAWKQLEEVVEPEAKEPTKEELKASAEEARLELVKSVDLFIDKLIEDKRSGVYTEAMKSLGGAFESDLDDLLDNATIEQLKDTLKLGKIKKPELEKKVSEKIKKEPSSKGKKEAPLPGSKSEKILEMLKEGVKSKQEIAKELGTYGPAIYRVAKLYL